MAKTTHLLGDMSHKCSRLRPIVAYDLKRVFMRSQQVISLAGNIHTGDIEEALTAFYVHLEPIQDENTCIGSPAYR